MNQEENPSNRGCRCNPKKEENEICEKCGKSFNECICDNSEAEINVTE